MYSLPPFLSVFHDAPSTRDELYQHAKFIHKHNLGSSHALWWPSCTTDREPDTILLFIPGNPGLSEFYIPFLSVIHESNASRNLAIMAHSHLDHHAQIDNPTSTRYTHEQSLTIQLECSNEILQEIKQHYSNKPRIIVVGHSVGAWISLQMLKSFPDDITSVFLLFPTLSHIAQTPNGKLLSPIFSRFVRNSLSFLSPLSSYLPRYAFSLIFPSWPESQLFVLRDFLSSRSCVFASLSMADQEMKTILDLDIPFLSQNTGKLFFYYGQVDDWIGEEKQALIRCFNAGDKSFRISHGPPGVPHAFCISHSEIVAKQCLEWLAKSQNES